jgi:hypothetical protein
VDVQLCICSRSRSRCGLLAHLREQIRAKGLLNHRSIVNQVKSIGSSLALRRLLMLCAACRHGRSLTGAVEAGEQACKRDRPHVLARPGRLET